MGDTAQAVSLFTGYVVLPEAGCVRFTGDDRRSFIQRQTTNHIDLLNSQRSLVTVLTSPTARILDVWMLVEGPDTILALTLPGRGASIAKYLHSRVFFMDKVTVSDDSARYAQLEVGGQTAGAALEQLGLTAPGEANQVARGQNGLSAVHLEPVLGMGYRLLVPLAELGEVERRLAEAGMPRIDWMEYSVRRLEAGLPSGSEWNEDYTPLETGLRMAISDSKGCYTGQEIIARQITYDKVTRGLCGLRLSGAAAAPADLFTLDGAPAGRMTSTGISQQVGPIGLAILRHSYGDVGITLRVGEIGQDITAEVVSLPFL